MLTSCRKRGLYLITTHERQLDILKLVMQLDISPTMYKNAVDKYKAIASFLEECGIKADIYPQGSFAFGTVVRPSVKDPNANYDLDFICQLHFTRDDIRPSELRQSIENALKSSDRYGGKLTKWGECFTIEYADISGVGFSIDIVPAADESFRMKNDLMLLSRRSDLINTAIAIPRQNGEKNYDWLTNNPRGFKTWFDEINSPFLKYRLQERRAVFFNEHRMIYNSIDEIPSGLDRSSMQRVIQILKFHRDHYYHNLSSRDKDDIKPISAIINTLTAEISKAASPTLSIFDLLAFVLERLNVYALQQTMRYDEFHRNYENWTAITRKNGEWFIENPANPEDNLADKWNDNSDIPLFFFKWIQTCYNDLVKSMKLPDDQFQTQIENAFGAETIQRNWGTKYSKSTPKPIITSAASKPYRKL